jgi:hypothetical protein
VIPGTSLQGGAIFINYRGRDSRSYGALLYLELSRRFGPENVFLDCESIPAGADYAEQLLDRVRLARVVLAVIGPGWLAGGGLRRRPRIRETTDWTRRELVEAFVAGVRVIPVLTDDAELPTWRQLPSCLAPLSRCQYRRLRCREASADLARIGNDLAAGDPELAIAASRPPDPAAGTELPPPADPRSPATVLARRLAIAAARVEPPQARPPHVTLYRSLVAGRKRCWPPDEGRRAEA